MSLEPIAVLGCTLAHGSGSAISGGTFVITATPNSKVLAESKGVYTTPLSFTFSGGSASGFVNGTVAGGGAIVGTAVKVLAGGIIVMREGDMLALMACVGTISPTPTPPAPPTGPVAGPVEISSAGQTKVNAQ